MHVDTMCHSPDLKGYLLKESQVSAAGGYGKQRRESYKVNSS